jgi:hypothetical protein
LLLLNDPFVPAQKAERLGSGFSTRKSTYNRFQAIRIRLLSRRETFSAAILASLLLEAEQDSPCIIALLWLQLVSSGVWSCHPDAAVKEERNTWINNLFTTPFR